MCMYKKYVFVYVYIQQIEFTVAMYILGMP